MSDGTIPPLNELLLWMVESGASDLHMSHNSPPVYRRNGALVPAPNMPALTSSDLW